jgi:hypothetical protein
LFFHITVCLVKYLSLSVQPRKVFLKPDALCKMPA